MIKKEYPKVTKLVYHVVIPRKLFQVCPNCGNPDIYCGLTEKEETPVIVCDACENEFTFHTSDMKVMEADG